MRRGRQVI